MKNSLVTPFRMNTYKSLDLKSFRINTYKKKGGGGAVILLTKFGRLSSSPYFVPSLLPLPCRSTLHLFSPERFSRRVAPPHISQGGLLWQQQSWNPPLKSAPTNFSSTTNGSTPHPANLSPPSTPRPAKSSLT